MILKGALKKNKLRYTEDKQSLLQIENLYCADNK